MVKDLTELLPVVTERLKVRAFRREDAKAFHAWRNVESYAHFMTWDFPYPLKKAESFCQDMMEAAPFAEGAWYQLIMEERSTKEPIGDIAIGNRVPPMCDDVVSLGYTLHGPYQGRGYMSEALRALLPQLIDPLAVKEFYAEVDEHNTPSRRLLEALGFMASSALVEGRGARNSPVSDVPYRLPTNAMVRG